MGKGYDFSPLTVSHLMANHRYIADRNRTVMHYLYVSSVEFFDLMIPA